MRRADRPVAMLLDLAMKAKSRGEFSSAEALLKNYALETGRYNGISLAFRLMARSATGGAQDADRLAKLRARLGERAPAGPG